MLTFEDHVRGIVARVSQRICILRLMKRVFVKTSVLLRCNILCICSHNPCVLFSCVGVCCWMSRSASRAPGVFGGEALPWADFLFVVSSTSCCCTLYVVEGKFELGSLLCFHLLLSEFDIRAAAAAHPFEFKISKSRTSHFARCFLPAKTSVWNDLPYTVIHAGTLDGFEEAVNRWLLPWVCFSAFRHAGAYEVAKTIYKRFCLSHLGLCCWFQ